MRKQRTTNPRFAICIRNDGYPASLEVRKLYRIRTDRAAGRHRLLRVVDESGEDYLYPDSFFAPVALPKSVERALRPV